MERIVDCHYPIPSFLRELHGTCEVNIVLSFSTFVFGNFRQYVVFDFGKELHLGLEMSVEIGSQEFLKEFSEEKTKLALDGPFWDDGYRTIVPFRPKTPSVFGNENLTDLYKLPRTEDIVPCPLLDESQGLHKDNYRDIMHQLLFVEEFYIRKQVARLDKNIHFNTVFKLDLNRFHRTGWLA